VSKSAKVVLVFDRYALELVSSFDRYALELVWPSSFRTSFPIFSLIHTAVISPKSASSSRLLFFGLDAKHPFILHPRSPRGGPNGSAGPAGTEPVLN
jgi:hypothetical protein